MTNPGPPPPSPEVAAAFAAFPRDLRKRLVEVRSLIFDVGREMAEIGSVQETLKWGEPSYLSLAGSTVRLGWKPTAPDCFAVHFHCQTKLVPTFRQIYPEVFRFEGNRAIVFRKDETVPQAELRHCLQLALTYHRRKHLDRLGAEDPKPGAPRADLRG